MACAKTLGLDFGPRPLVCGYFRGFVSVRLGPRTSSLFNGSRPDQGQLMIGDTRTAPVTLVTVLSYEIAVHEKPTAPLTAAAAWLDVARIAGEDSSQGDEKLLGM